MRPSKPSADGRAPADTGTHLVRAGARPNDRSGNGVGQETAVGRNTGRCNTKRWADERGSASVEFITAGLLLLLPLVYLVLVLAAVQAGALAAEASARTAARAFVLHPDPAQAEAAADQAVRFVLADFGVAPEAVEVEVACDRDDCFEPGALVRFTVSVEVPLPFVPPALPGDFPLAVTLSGTSVQRVSTFGPG